jgi:cytochrome c oxidase cbb3-type subunit IV
MSISFVQSVWTVIAMSVFIGIVIWAYSSRRKADFDEAGRIVTDDDKPGHLNSNKIEE